MDKSFSKNVQLLAIGQDGKEIGRTRIAIDEKEPMGKYFDFAFDSRTPLLTADHFELK